MVGSHDFDPAFALIQVDFSENYTCTYQDEIQSAHWQQKQVSLFTTAIWFEGKIHPTVLASDNRIHAKETIGPYIDYLLSTLPKSVKTVSLWSDGPSSQLKNKYICQPDTKYFRKSMALPFVGIILQHHTGKVRLMELVDLSRDKCGLL